MLEERGNAWAMPCDALCITTNGDLNRYGHAVMGRGIAFEAKQKIPGIARLLGDAIYAGGNRVHHLWIPDEMFVGIRPRAIVSFPVKRHWHEMADLALIAQSAFQLLALVDGGIGWKRILLPRPGCGNGGLRWVDVKPLIEQILDDRFVAVDF